MTLKFQTPESRPIIVSKFLERGFYAGQCIQMTLSEWQTLQTLIKLLLEEQFDLGLQCLLRPVCLNI